MNMPEPEVRSVVLGPISTNCWVLKCRETRIALVVDPGGNTAPLVRVLSEMEVREVATVLNTHGHFDHVWGNGELGFPTAIHRLDAPMLAAAAPMAAEWGYSIAAPPVPARVLEDGDTVRAGSLRFKVIHTPGHSPGSICLLGHGLLVSGDTLFQGSVGRTDLQGSDPAQLLTSLRERILPLSDSLMVLPGHGPATTMKRERLTNPFLEGL